MPRAKKNTNRRAAKQGRRNNPAPRRRQPQVRRRAPQRVNMASRVPAEHPASMVAASCRALALSSPCAFLEKTKTGEVNPLHARDASTALNTTVLPVQGPVPIQCDAGGRAMVVIAACPTGSIRYCGANYGADTFADLPSGGAFLSATERQRLISMEVSYQPTMSTMNNQGNLTIASLDAPMATLDYLAQGATTLTDRISVLKGIIDSRPPQSYQFSPVKIPNRAVVGVQDNWDFITVSGVAYSLVAPGNRFTPSFIAGNNALTTITSPTEKTLYFSDLLPQVVILIDGANANASFTLQICALFEAVPGSAMIGTFPAPSGGSAGFSNIATKVRANAATLQHAIGVADKVEHYVERGAEGALKIASAAGLGWAGDAAMALHAGQSGLEKLEHWMGFSG